MKNNALKKIFIFVPILILFIAVQGSQLFYDFFCGDVMNCRGDLRNFFFSTLVLAAVVPMSIIFYFTRDSIFKIWAILTLLWIPWAIYIVYDAEGSGGWAVPGQPLAAMMMGVMYITASLLLLVGLKLYYRFRKK